MNVTSIASNVYSQYQSTIDGLKNGTVSYLDAMDKHRELAPQARGLAAVGVVKAASEQTRIRTTDIPADFIERMQASLAKAKSDHALVAQAYQDAGGEHADNSTKITWDSPPAVKPMQIIGSHTMGQVRSVFNAEAYGYLSSYASEHKSEWMATAESLGLSIEGGMYLLHFYKQPDESGIDVSMGVPNSQAEQIFRHIASANDITAFEAGMAPAQKEMENRMTDHVANLMDSANEKMKAFAPHVPAMEAAGLTINDMARAMITRGEGDEYRVIGATDKSEAIEAFVNGNPDVRALYDADFNHLTRRKG